MQEKMAEFVRSPVTGKPDYREWIQAAGHAGIQHGMKTLVLFGCSPCVSGSFFFFVAVVVSSDYVFWAGEKLLKKQM